MTNYNNTPEQRLSPDVLANYFTYHAPKGDQLQRYAEIRARAAELAATIVQYCPPCADTTVAVRKLREVVMSANLSIACNE